jgi:hypothetical protein
VKPGDVVTCSDCGATAEARWLSAERPWQEGYALRVTWANGPFPRHEAATRSPERCLWCHDRALGYPSLLSRPGEGGEAWLVTGPLASYQVPPIPGVKATPLGERAGWEELRAQPPLSVGEGPLNVGNPPPPKADGSGGNKAPLERSPATAAALERFEDLAEAFHLARGIWPPGHRLAHLDAATTAAERERAWSEWLEEQKRDERAARASAKPKPPKGQLSLL